VTLSDDDRTLFAFRRNTLVAASAGTGKTHRLTSIYALLTLGLTSLGRPSHREAGPRLAPGQIVAATFSRAAAAEVRSRLDALLGALAASGREGPTPLDEALAARCDDLGRPLRPAEIAALAAEARDALASAPVDTLHGFAGKLVRNVAVDVGLSPSFVILEEDEADELLARAVDDVLVESLDDDRREAAEHLVDVSGGVSEARATVSSLLRRLDEEGVAAGALGLVDESPFARELAADLLAGLAQLCDEGPQSLRPIAERALAAAAPLFDESGHCRDGARLREGLAGLEGRPLAARGAPPPRLAALFDAWGAPRAAAFDALCFFLANFPRFGAQGESLRRLLADVAKRRQRELRRRSAMGFGDLVRTARNALRDHPELARAAAAPYAAILIDEFQDTSPVQRDLVYLLHEDPDARRERRPGAMPGPAALRPSGLLVVGDRKQAIYGFRGADVGVFTRLCLELGGDRARAGLGLGPGDAPAAELADYLTLRDSFRSTEPVLDFVNAFCGRDMRSEGGAYEMRYTEDDRLRRAERAGEEGPPEPVEVLLDDGTTPEGVSPYARALSAGGRGAAVAAGRVAHLIASGEARPGEIAVLARENATLARVATALGRLEVPYALAGRGLLRTREVRDAVAMLRLLVDPNDRQALASVLRGPWVGLDDASIVLLARPGKGLLPPDAWAEASALAGLEPGARELARAFAEALAGLRASVAALPPAAALDAARERFAFDEVLASLPRASTRLAHLDRFRALAAEHGGSLPSFVRAVSKRIDDDEDEDEPQIVSTGDDAVRLMTVHAAKGLEFPVVVLVDLDRWGRARPQRGPLSLVAAREREAPVLAIRLRDGSGTAISTPGLRRMREVAEAREAAEARRLTYVALTRARRKLALVLPLEPALKPSPGSPAPLLRTLLGEGVLPDSTLLPRDATPFLLDPPPPIEPPPETELVPALGRTRRGLAPLVIDLDELVAFDACPRLAELGQRLALPPPTGQSPLPPSTREAARRALASLLEGPPPEGGRPRPAPADLRDALAREGVADAAPLDALADALARLFDGPSGEWLRYATIRCGLDVSFALGPSAHARSTLDLVALRRDGSALAVALRPPGAAPAVGRGALARGAQAYALHRAFGLADVTSALATLGAPAEAEPPGDAESTTFGPADFDELGERLARASEALQTAAAEGTLASREPATCRALGCAYLAFCHREAPPG
jgi:ATP-dependent helicase/nuclease subunit A